MKSQIKAILLIQAGEVVKEKKIQRAIKNEHPGMNAETTVTSAFTLIISSLNTKRTYKSSRETAVSSSLTRSTELGKDPFSPPALE